MKRFIVAIFLLVVGLWVPTAQADIGQKIRGIIIENAKEALSDGSSSTLSSTVTRIVNEVLAEVKVPVEKEVRNYAKKFGDTVSERLMENQRVKKFVNTVEVACWAITIYLILITLLLFLSLRKLHANDRIILKLLDEIKRREEGSA